MTYFLSYLGIELKLLKKYQNEYVNVREWRAYSKLSPRNTCRDAR